MIIGITGGIGSGKTTLCNKLREAGYLVFDSDNHAHSILNNDLIVRNQIIDLFGVDAYTIDGLNRAFIANLVFNDAEKLEKLNAIVHPVVYKAFDQWVADNSSCSLLFIESAILLKGKLHKLVDKVVLVTASVETRIKRICARDGATEDQVMSRISKQMPDSEMLKLADFVIDTDKKQIHELSITVFLDYVKHFRK